MPYMVTFQTGDGKDGFHLCRDKDDALRMAEHYRNTDDVADLNVYRVEEVPLEFRAYFRVEFSEEIDGQVAGPQPAASEVIQEHARTAMPRAASYPEAIPEIPQVQHVEPPPPEPPPEVSREPTFGIFSRP